MIEVITPGIQTTVQDGGRLEHRAIGVGFSGVMDRFSFAVANHLVMNAENSAVLEITYGNASFRFHSDTFIALTGAEVSATLDSKAIACWWCFPVKAGQVLRLQMSTQGLRSYLAVAGGFDSPIAMGSRSTDLKMQLGGVSGRPLRKGDELATYPHSCSALSPYGLSKSLQPKHSCINEKEVVRFIPSAEWPCLTNTSQKAFLSSRWQVSNETNRLGARLKGQPLTLHEPLELMSHGIVPGCIQLPPSGQPVIQLQDANTCGGYPKIGVVIASDMKLLGQIKPGNSLAFELCSVEEALDIAEGERQKLLNIFQKIDVMRSRLF